jgi:CPA1 family monovalent cation:H+ antiporter
LPRRDPLLPWQWIFFLGFVGVRGVVSLAAALAIPLTTPAGAPFPDRDLILFITFGLIVITLVARDCYCPVLFAGLASGVTPRKSVNASTKTNLLLGRKQLSVLQA